MIVGNYKIQKLLGEGAFGWTYTGKHVLLGTKVCLKREKTRQEPYMTMFREEARLVALLRHPSLPTLMDYHESDMDIGGGDKMGQIMVLSYIEGSSLEADVEQNGPIDDEHICWIIDRVLGALSYLHGRHGMIHCDLKPANAILDTPDHNVTLVDLGMAALKPDAQTLAKGGTPDYMPPEFALGLPPIPASDLYSLGKMIIFCAGGDVASGNCPANMNPKLIELVNSLIRRDPTQRPQDATRLRGSLAVLRNEMFGRSTCAEIFKRRK